MTEELFPGHRVLHIRDGLVGTIAGIEPSDDATRAARKYQVNWDNGSLESRVDSSEIMPASPDFKLLEIAGSLFQRTADAYSIPKNLVLQSRPTH